MTFGKVSLLKYNDFEGQPIPEMTQRVKINLREQEIDVFDYSGQFARHPLCFKSRLIPRGFLNYDAQRAFDLKLADLGCIDVSGFDPTRNELHNILLSHGVCIAGFDLLRIHSPA